MKPASLPAIRIVTMLLVGTSFVVVANAREASGGVGPTPGIALSGTPASPTTLPGPVTCGVGVCVRLAARSGCVPGNPITANDGWLTKEDPTTHSWDANCDGKTEKQTYPEEVYSLGCVSETPKFSAALQAHCETKRVRDPACGESWASHPCELSKDKLRCEVGGLKGAVTQACR